MIFLDSNLPMYLVGAEHPNKIAARRLLERAIADGERLVTDAEVLQEILHRYAAIGRRDAIQPAFDALLNVVDEVFPVAQGDVERAKDLVQGYPGLSARDALHVALMERNGVSRMLSFDAGFDQVPGIRRMA
ncbi:MAG: type II toxin-antitoxin system VapC family toxin [Pseudomonadota bacterium]